MYSLTTGLFCESVLRDAESNNVSAINIFEEINFRSFPGLTPKLSAYFFIERQAEDEVRPMITFSLSLAGKTIINQQGMRIDFGAKNGTRLAVTVGGLVLPEPGRVEAKVRFDESGAVLAYSIDCRLEAGVGPQVNIAGL